MPTARILGAWLLLAGVSTAAIAQDRRSPPEAPATPNQASQFLAEAQAWLDENPDDPRAPRLLQDMLMTATVVRLEPQAKAAKLQLLLAYPDSLPTRYLAQSSRPDEVRTVLMERFKDASRPINRQILSQYSRVIDSCAAGYGPAFFDDDLRVVAALATRKRHVAAQLHREISDREGDAARTLDVALDQRLSARERLLELQALYEYEPARAFQTYLYHEQLDDDERQDFDVRVLVAGNLLADAGFTDALPLLTGLCSERRAPRLLVWLGWAQAACGRFADAEETLLQVAGEFPDSAWTGTARTLGEVLAAFDREIERQSLVLDRMVRELKRIAPEMIELTFDWNGGGATPRHFYVNLDLPHDAMELACHADGKMLVAIQSGPEGSRLYFAGESKIHEFTGPGMSPLCQFTLAEDERQAINWNFHFDMTQQGHGALEQSYTNLLSVPAAQNAVVRQELLQRLGRRGWFPHRERDGSEFILRWISLQLNYPQPRSIELQLTEDHRLSSLSSSAGNGIRTIQYGARDKIQLTAPRWPALPVETVKESGLAHMFRVFGAVASLFDTTKPDRTKSAAHENPTGGEPTRK